MPAAFPVCSALPVVGVGKIAFVLLVALYLCYWATMVPLSPSAAPVEAEAAAQKQQARIVGKVPSALHTVALLVLPGAVHAALHARHLFVLNYIMETLLLFALPTILLLSTLADKGIAEACIV